MMYDNDERARARDVLANRVDKLEAFGSADQIRDYFVQEQVAGHCSERHSCVVAVYLAREIKAELGRSWVMSVDHQRLGLALDEDCEDDWGRPTPPAVADLIVRFDEKKYPELQGEVPVR